MAFRFRRSKKIAPGVKLNVSKSGPSITFGKHVKTTVGHGRVTRSVRTPVKGLYYSSTTRTKSGNSKTVYNNRKTGKQGGGIIGWIVALFALCGILAIGVMLLYVLIIAALLLTAYIYYKANTELDPDQVERLASILYTNEPEKKYGPVRVYMNTKSALKNLPEEIRAKEKSIDTYTDDNIPLLCKLIDERNRIQWQNESLKEIMSEPGFYNPEYNDYYGEAFSAYIDRTFTPVFNDAETLKTERGKKNRYIKYLERFKFCYLDIPDSAREVVDAFAERYDIQSSLSF